MSNGITYIPFRNVVNDKYGMNAVYECDIQHEFSLVNDGGGEYHFELRCCGPMRIRGRLNQLCPNLNRRNGIGTYIVDLSDQNLGRWKKRFVEYFALHREEIELEYERMRKEDMEHELTMLHDAIVDDYLEDIVDRWN